MDFRETEEQIMLRKMVRKFAQEEVKPVGIEYDKKTDPKDCYPWELLKKASKLGLRTMAIPTEYGGGGVKDLLSYVIASEELATGDSGFASSVRHTIAMSASIDVLCNQQQKDEFFPKIVKDDTFLIATPITEPNSGTDNNLMADVPGAALQTFAEKRGDKYIINGSKHFITNGGIAKLYLLNTRTDRKLPLNQCRSIFLVTPDMPGFSIGKFHNKIGNRLMLNAELFFDDMSVPARHLIGGEGKAAHFLSGIPFLDFLAPSTRMGLLRECYDNVVAYARTRIQGGKPIIQHQLIAAQLAEMRVGIESARIFLYRQAWCWQNKCDYDHKLTILLRPLITQLSGKVLFQMQDIVAGPAVYKEMIIEKLTRDLITIWRGPTLGAGLIRGAPEA
jgi:alkylation response protein AidB-like acyl-CoA dehydrogenase